MLEVSGYLAGETVMSGEHAQAPRVLVVRSAGLRDRVAAALAGARLDVKVESSPSYLAAMGWLANERVDVVIGPVSAMTGMVASTAKSLRRLAPGTRLIAVATEHERAEAGAALNAGFDQCVFEPADATELLSSLRLVVADPSDASGNETSQKLAYEPEPHETHHAETNHDAQAGGASGYDWVKHEFEERPPVQPSSGLGDVDLAEAVMRGDGSLLPMAVRLLRDQSGVSDAEFVPGQQELSPDVAAAAVVYGGETLGHLVSYACDRGTQQSLGSWASWLARWVALDLRQSDLYSMAMHDELTGIWNRRYFDRFLSGVLDHAANGRQQVTLMVFDIDNFKLYNDNYGHPAGDRILQSTANLIQSVVRDHDVVARIGGDEFAVVFWDKGEPRHLGSQHPDNVIGIAKRFQKAIWEHGFPELGEDAVGNLTVSGGLAGFPWDGRTPDELLARADAMAIQSKRQGKNVICFGPGAAPNGNGHGHA